MSEPRMSRRRVHGLHVRYDRVEALQGLDFVASARDRARRSSDRTARANRRCSRRSPGSAAVGRYRARAGPAAARTSAGHDRLRAAGRGRRLAVSGAACATSSRWGAIRASARSSAFSAHDRRAVARAIDALDLGALADRHISELSGGQQQRAFVARAIAQEPLLLLLDEPTTGVDAATEESLLRLVRGLVADGLPVLMTTHDLDRAPEWFDRLIVVDRRILADGTPDDVLESGAYAAIREHTHTHGHRCG